MLDPETAPPKPGLRRCWHWLVTLAILVIGWAVYLIWFVPPDEYDFEPPGRYNSWFWFFGTVVIVTAAVVIENRKRCLPRVQD